MHIETCRVNGQAVEVQFCYFPEERQTWEEPGCSAEYEIAAVMYKGIDVYMLLDQDTLDNIEYQLEKGRQEDFAEAA